MNKSESIKELATALAKFQGEIKNPNNTATNPFFKSKYAPLSDVLNAVRPILSKNGLSVLQSPSGDGEHIIVTTTLIHSSGEWIESPELVLKADKATAQGAGSAITYARRYAISAILGISSEDDDDGNEAEKQAPTKKEVKSEISENQIKRLFAIASSKGISKEVIDTRIKADYKKDSSKELNKKEYEDLVKRLEAIKIGEW